MTTRTGAVLTTVACCVSFATGGAAGPTGYVRDLPDFYIPGETLTVRLRPGAFTPSWIVLEVIPPGWRPVDLDSDPYWWAAFDESRHTILFYGVTPDLVVIPEQDPTGPAYKVLPPPDYVGPAYFEGHEMGGFVTVGDTVIYPRKGSPRYRPLWASIQETIDGCDWGDTVMVSAGDTVFAEHITMKRGVGLVGYVGPGSSQPPRLRSNSWPLPAITAAPYCKISGFIVGWSACGIRVEDPTVEISNCVITGTQDAAIEYVGATEGKITNCTIVGNNGVGILCHEASPGVVVSNSILYANGGKDVENCAARFCLLEDEIEPDSGENNIFADPMFVNPAEGDYRLLRGSPCIDAGDSTGIAADAEDILSKPRILFGGKSETVDLGAYEYWFISASRLPGTTDLQLRWSSRPEKTYSVFFSDDLITWHLADDIIPSAGNVSVWSDPIGWPPSVPIRFYRITEDE